MRMLLSSANIRLCSLAPYLAQLYRDDLRQHIQYPAAVVDHRCTRPLGIQKSNKTYFIPGNRDDLILYTSCIAACGEAILRSLPFGAQEDVGPPSAAELARGFSGEQRSIRAAWRALNTVVQQRLRAGCTVVVADIASCIARINPERLHTLLLQTEADPAAVEQLRRMHRFWQGCGCQGLPLTGGFRLLIKLYLAEVDACLRENGIAFIRLQDDFRLFCRSREDAMLALSVLERSLERCGLGLNPAKTQLIEPGSPGSWRVHRQAIAHRFSDGLGLPLLGEMLAFDGLRPLALLLLRRLYGHQCWPFAVRAAAR